MALTVEEVHRDLGYTAEDAAALKKVKLVWQKLDSARKQAERNPSLLPAYHSQLTAALTQLRKTQPVEDIEAASAAFWKWYDAQCAILGIPEKEQNRGKAHQEWCERWLPNQHRMFCEAISRLVELPTPDNFDRAKRAASVMLRAYCEAI